MLKSGGSDGRGVTAKVVDFGLSVRMVGIMKFGTVFTILLLLLQLLLLLFTIYCMMVRLGGDCQGGGLWALRAHGALAFIAAPTI